MRTIISIIIAFVAFSNVLKAQDNVSDFNFYPMMSTTITETQDTLLNIQVNLSVPDTNLIESIHYQIYDVFNDQIIKDVEIPYHQEMTNEVGFMYLRKALYSELHFLNMPYTFYQVSIRLKDVNQNYTEFKTK